LAIPSPKPKAIQARQAGAVSGRTRSEALLKPSEEEASQAPAISTLAL
jgi:hypothetical protein